jgi:hypothetical protein
MGYKQRLVAAEHGSIALLHRDTHFTKLGEVLAFENVELPESWPFYCELDRELRPI